MLWGYSPNFIKQVPLLNGTRGAKTCQTREFDIGVDKHSKLDPKEQQLIKVVEKQEKQSEKLSLEDALESINCCLETLDENEK